MATLAAYIREHGIRADARRADDNPNMTDMPAGSSHWRVTLHNRAGRQLTVPFSQGPAISREPSTADILDCLVSDASSADQSFEDWCDDYGYDTDSRKAERTYRAVVAQTAKLRRFAGESFDVLMFDTERE